MQVLEELETLHDQIVYLVRRWSRFYPGLHENYTLLMLLYLEEFQGIEIDHSVLRHAADHKLVNFTSLHRAITVAKKLFQDERDRDRSYTREAEYHQALLALSKSTRRTDR